MEMNSAHINILSIFEDAGAPPYTVYSDIMEPITVFPDCATTDNLRLALKDQYTTAVSFEVMGTVQKFDLLEEDCGLKIH